MGIDLWVARGDGTDVETAEHTAALASVSAASALPGTGSQTTGALADLSAAGFASVFGDCRVSVSVAVNNPVLLVITEDLSLSAECHKLLGNMLQAIEYDNTQWMHAGLSSRADATTVSALCSSVQPRGVLLMLKAGAGNGAIADELNQLRKQQHQVASVAPFVAVTFHPQDLLDNPDAKRPAWEDLKQLRQWLG